MITATLAPVTPLGAFLLTNFATVSEFTSQPCVPSLSPAGSVNAPPALSYVNENAAEIAPTSVPVPLVMPAV